MLDISSKNLTAMNSLVMTYVDDSEKISYFNDPNSASCLNVLQANYRRIKT